MRATWVGHASVALDCGARRFLLDPVWTERLAGWVDRLQPPGIKWHEVGATAAVLVSHDHADHLDKKTLRRLERATPIIVPHGVGRWFRRNGFTDVRELGWWETTWVGDVQIQLTPAHHGSDARWGKVRALWGGFILHHAGLTAYYAGDTAYGEVFHEVAARTPVDVAILPIGAYAPREVNGQVHMDPEEALQAFRDLGARTMLPVHWGTFRLSPEPVHEPITRLVRAWDAAGLEPERLAALEVGANLAVTPRSVILPGTRSAPSPRRPTIPFVSVPEPSPGHSHVPSWQGARPTPAVAMPA